MRTEPTPMVTYRLHTNRQFSLYVEEDIELQAYVLKNNEAHQKLLDQRNSVREVCREFQKLVRSAACCTSDNEDLSNLIKSIEKIYGFTRGLSLFVGDGSSS